MKNIRNQAVAWLGGFTLLLAASLIIVLVWPSPLEPALACDASGDGNVLAAFDMSQAPAEIVTDARKVAHGFYPAGSSRAEDMTSQLVGTYLAAEDKAFVLIFNPGGWGWDPIGDIPGWESIMFGIRDTLGGMGYNSLLVDYKRTRHGFDGVIGEIEDLMGVQPDKAEELAARVDFLTRHIPNLRVILTGESNGATIADNALRLLKDNNRVFAIETGPPVWHPSLEFERSLVITNNGDQPDTFTTGDIILIIRSNAESALGIYRGARGDILLYIGAPGHFYSWDYPAVKREVQDYLAANFEPVPVQAFVYN